MKSKFLVMCPFTGLGLYGGMRGSRWLRNRIKIFVQFVVPALLKQTEQDFVLWVAWRREERDNIYVRQLLDFLQMQFGENRVVFTYSGVPMYDDKYEDDTARDRFFSTIKGFPELMDFVPDCDEVQMLIQPSDDVYDIDTIRSIKEAFKTTDAQAVVFEKGYICNYQTLEIAEYNPNTLPPFAAIKFKREVFFDPGKHMTYLGLKKDVGKYKKGTPYPSHEYLADCLRVGVFPVRGFIVGTHGENISTYFNHPFKGEKVEGVLEQFGLGGVKPLVLPISYRKWMMRKLPHQWQRKLRYIGGELFVNKFYHWIRN